MSSDDKHTGKWADALFAWLETNAVLVTPLCTTTIVLLTLKRSNYEDNPFLKLIFMASALIGGWCCASLIRNGGERVHNAVAGKFPKWTEPVISYITILLAFAGLVLPVFAALWIVDWMRRG